MGSIYVLVDPFTGDIRYVGWTVKTLKQRLARHLRQAEETHRARWVRTLLNASTRPIIRLVQQVADADWKHAERYWISFFKKQGCALTNGTDGGDGALGHQPSDETRAKRSAALKGRVFTEEWRKKIGAASSNRSPETLARIAASSKDRKASPETRQKMSAAGKGRKKSPRSQEHRARLSAANKGKAPPNKGKPSLNRGKPLSSEHRAAISTALKGRIFTEEWRKKIGIAGKGRTLSPEHRAALSEGRRKSREQRPAS